MSYAVKELFKTLQGEGARAGRAAVFCRFAGCNLWSGLEKDRAGAKCSFCDTDFVGMDGANGGRYPTAEALADKIGATWGPGLATRYVVFTGGEPLLQLDAGLIAAMRERQFEIAIETNGTLPAPAGIDWICVSPKSGTELRLRIGNELKLVIPQVGVTQETYEALDFQHFFVQPMAGPELAANTGAAIAWCLANPRWRLSLQTHKLIGIP